MGINSFSPANNIAALNGKVAAQLAPVSLGAGLSVPISATDLWVTQATFYGYSAVSATGVPTNNPTNIAVGASNPVNRVLDVVVPGGSLTYAPAAGTKFNLKDIVAAGGNGTAVVVSYLQ